MTSDDGEPREINGVAGESLDFIGRAKMDIELDGAVYEGVPAEVIREGRLLLLGNDFLVKHQAIIKLGVCSSTRPQDPPTHEISLKRPHQPGRARATLKTHMAAKGARDYALRSERESSRLMWATTVHTVLVPPKTDRRVWATVPRAVDGEAVTVAALDGSQHGGLTVHHDKAVVRDGHVSVWLHNESTVAIEVRSGTCIAQVRAKQTRGTAPAAASRSEGERVAASAVPSMSVVYSTEQTEIPAFSEVHVWLQAPDMLDGKLVCVDAPPRPTPGATTSPAICRVVDGKVPIRLVNRTRRPVTIPIHVEVARVEPEPEACELPPAKDPHFSAEELWRMYEPTLGHLSESEKREFRSWLERSCDVFTRTPKAPPKTHLHEHVIDTGAHPPIKMRRRRYSPEEQDAIDKAVEQLERDNLIRKSTSPWSCQLVLVKKKPNAEGKVEYRICCDFRAVNAVTKPERRVAPTVGQLLEILGWQEGKRVKFWSQADLASAFHHVGMSSKHDSIAKTAFDSGKGLYEWLRCPFGLVGASMSFQTAVDTAFEGLANRILAVYADDVVCFSTAFEQHLRHLDSVIERMRAASLSFRADKCSWCQLEIEFLSYRVGRDGIRTAPFLTQKVADMPPPRSLELLKKGADMSLLRSARCIECHADLRAMLVSDLVLAFPNLDAGGWTVYVDAASTRGLGYVLHQEQPEGGSRRECRWHEPLRRPVRGHGGMAAAEREGTGEA
mmetsp:Transcript_38355/g.65809  ORF Transcript_38355/g.65809 Transcript_38355/m.65809 type:complete len:728 (+) Transcript_38355:902-3085(+)